jgi:hypothetical protein
VFALVLALLLAVAVPLLHGAWKKAQAAADDVRPSRGCRLEPVVYEGWSGSVHTFYFTNADFCDLFRAANARKLVG